MAENSAAAVEAQPKPKRSLLKLGLLVLNVLIFFVGVGSLAWSKFASKPVASATAQEQENHAEPQDENESAAAKGHAAAPKKQEDQGGAAKGGHGSASKSGHGSAAKSGHGSAAKGGHGSAAKGGSGDSMLVPLAPFIVNLNGDNGQRYLRLVAQVEARGDMAKAELEAHLPEVRDRLIFLLTSKTFADVGSVQGKYDLQADITKNINETLDGPFVKKTYFTEFIVQ